MRVMPNDFSIVSAVEALAPSRFAVTIPDGWQQGRGAFGGLVLATLLRAIEKSEPDDGRATRTLAGDLCGPALPGPAEIRVRALRRGNNQSNLAAELVQGGEVLATASVVRSTPRRAAGVPPLPRTSPSPLPPWRELPDLGLGPPLGPPFAQHYEYRAAGAAFALGSAAVLDGYIRERVPLGRIDAPALIGRLDAWWPTLFAVSAPRPCATISFVAEILVDPATLPPDEPLRHHARMSAAHDGFFVELRELWSGDRVVAMNQQTFAILK